jgi:hypothetical protein
MSGNPGFFLERTSTMSSRKSGKRFFFVFMMSTNLSCPELRRLRSTFYLAQYGRESRLGLASHPKK